MPLKFKISKSEFDAIVNDNFLKKEYAQIEGTEEYQLNVEGVEDTGALKRAKDHEKKLRKEAETARDQLKSQLEELNEQVKELETIKAGKDDKSVQAEKLYQAKLDKVTKELNAKTETYRKMLIEQTASAEANRLAAELGGERAEILLPHVRSRITVDLAEDGKPTVKILDTDGTVGASTPDDLKKEFLSNAKFSSIVVGSKASGGGASGSNKNAGSVKKLNEMTATEEAIFAKENPQEYQRMVQAEGGAQAV